MSESVATLAAVDGVSGAAVGTPADEGAGSAVASVVAVVESFAGIDVESLSAAELIDCLRGLERVKSAGGGGV